MLAVVRGWAAEADVADLHDASGTLGLHPTAAPSRLADRRSWGAANMHVITGSAHMVEPREVPGGLGSLIDFDCFFQITREPPVKIDACLASNLEQHLAREGCQGGQP